MGLTYHSPRIQMSGRSAPCGGKNLASFPFFLFLFSESRHRYVRAREKSLCAL